MGKITTKKQDSVKIYKIRKTLDELTQQEGHGTELISVYIPKNKQLHEVITTLREEQGTADNIKSDLILSAVPCSSRNVVITSWSCLFFGMYTLISSVPCPSCCVSSSRVFLIL